MPGAWAKMPAGFCLNAHAFATHYRNITKWLTMLATFKNYSAKLSILNKKLSQ